MIERAWRAAAISSRPQAGVVTSARGTTAR